MKRSLFTLSTMVLVWATALVLLTACTSPAAISDQTALNTFLTQLNNTATTDLAGVQAVALAEFPVNNDLYSCAASAVTVQTAIVKVMTAAQTKSGAPPGPVTVAALTLAFVPGSDQYNWALKTINTGCANELIDVQGQIASLGSPMAALASVLKLAPAAAL